LNRKEILGEDLLLLNWVGFISTMPYQIM